MHSDIDELVFQEVDRYKDTRAGRWPPAVLRGLAQAARLCLLLYAKRRASVRMVLPMLEVLEDAAAKGKGARN